MEGKSKTVIVLEEDRRADELPEDASTLTPRERELRKAQRRMSQLRDYLAYPRWRSDDAVWIIAGLDPELTVGSPGDWGLAFLPEGRRKNWVNYDGSIDPIKLEEHVLMALHEVEGFVQGESRKPIQWINHALAHGYTPPWIPAARIDEECRQLLADLSANGSYRDHVPASSGKAKAKKSSPGRAKREVVFHWDQWQNEPALYRDHAHFIEDMNLKYLDEEDPKDGSLVVTGPTTIRRWVTDLRKVLHLQCSSGIVFLGSRSPRGWSARHHRVRRRCRALEPDPDRFRRSTGG